MQTTPLKFALAGQIVSAARQASRILRTAVLLGQHWLIPQARSVRRKLLDAGQR